MSARFIGLTAAACGAVGAVATLRRLRTLALIPRIFTKSDRGGTVPNSEPGNLRTAFAVALIWGMDKLVARLLRAARLASVPSSIVSLLLAFGGLTAVELTAGARTADRIQTFFKPGVDFLGRWMMAVYTVSIVPLPTNLGAFSGVGDIVKVSAIHAGCWLASLGSTALVVRSLTGRAAPSAAAKGVPAKSAPAKRTPTAPPSQAQTHRAAVRSVWTTLTAASFALIPWLGEAPALFCTLLSTLLHSERLPMAMQQRGFHPVIVAGVVTASATALLGWSRGAPMADAFGRYLTKRGVLVSFGWQESLGSVPKPSI